MSYSSRTCSMSKGGGDAFLRDLTCDELLHELIAQLDNVVDTSNKEPVVLTSHPFVWDYEESPVHDAIRGAIVLRNIVVTGDIISWCH